MRLKLQEVPYRSSEQILADKAAIKEEIVNLLTDPQIDLSTLSRPHFTDLLSKQLLANGWRPAIFSPTEYQLAKIEFVKDRVGLEVGFRHTSLIGPDLLKFQIASPYGLNKIDLALYIVTTKNFQKYIKTTYKHNWSGAMNFEKVDRYLRHFTNGIQVPVHVFVLDVI